MGVEIFRALLAALFAVFAAFSLWLVGIGAWSVAVGELPWRLWVALLLGRALPVFTCVLVIAGAYGARFEGRWWILGVVGVLALCQTVWTRVFVRRKPE